MGGDGRRGHARAERSAAGLRQAGGTAHAARARRCRRATPAAHRPREHRSGGWCRRARRAEPARPGRHACRRARCDSACRAPGRPHAQPRPARRWDRRRLRRP
ncbi:hypothetical protein, partial [Terrabacter sp. Soil810]|uniref:hypothetical protein n=1 Tax=Terrabacter sp. Soil810 TaxID=1736418 RepID=UPI0035186CEC